MKRVLITFSGSDYDATTERIIADNRVCADGLPNGDGYGDGLARGRYGFTDFYVFDDVWLQSHPFYELNRWIFEVEPRRCFGYCSWKPLIIIETMKHLADGDVVFYVDADCRPVADLSPIFDIAERDGACFFAACGHRQPTWCKPECYLAMGEELADVEAGCARFVAFRKGGWREEQFLAEWLTYSVNRLANTKETRAHLAHGGFQEHRDEQAIMTNLVHKYKYRLHRECDQTGEGPTWRERDRELYPQLFEMVHQTKGNNGAGSRFRRTP